MRQQSFQKALSKMTGRQASAFSFVASLLFAGLTACYNRWLCLAELVLVLILYLYFQTGITRRKKEDHGLPGPHDQRVDAASPADHDHLPPAHCDFPPGHRRHHLEQRASSHLTGDPDHLLRPNSPPWCPPSSPSGCWMGTIWPPSPFRWGRNSILVYGNLVCTGDEDAFLATTYWVDVTGGR